MHAAAQPEDGPIQALVRAGVPPPGQGEADPESRHFKDQRATKTLLAFLAATNIGCFLGSQHGKQTGPLGRPWGLELVEEAETRWRGSREGNLGTPR
jgi:hypothetical protein